MPPDCGLMNKSGQMQISGTKKCWQDLVRVARHSTAMTLALCAAFAAVLLVLVGRASFAIMLVGPSKIGKSLVQLVAASVLGYGREQDLPSLNATPAGLLAAALGLQ